MSLRNLNKIREIRYIDIKCIDTGKSIKGTIIAQKPDYIVVEITGGLRISLQKIKKGVFIGTSNGLEFECLLNK